MKKKWVASGADLKLDPTPIDYVVEGMIQAGTVNLAVGDSGIGKSAFLYQLGLSVASGAPFLGMKTKERSVLILDYENGSQRGIEIAHTISQFLGLPGIPENFWRHVEEEPIDEGLFPTLIRSIKPGLVLIDPLRYFDPRAEKDNGAAMAMLTPMLNLTKELGTTFLILHHTRKNRDPRFPPLPLEDLTQSALTWCEEAAGPRAFVNQTHSRLGLARGSGDSAILLRGHLKTEGEFGPLQIERVLDDEGQARGYARRMGGQGLKAEQWEVLNALPDVFLFKHAKTVMVGKSNAVVARMLARFVATGAVIHNRELKTYTKVQPDQPNTPPHV